MIFKTTGRLAIIFSILISSAQAEDVLRLQLKSGVEKIQSQSIDAQKLILSSSTSDYFILSFNNIPNQEEKEVLTSKGIRLFGFLPEKSFYASIPKSISPADLKLLDFHSVTPIENRMKYHPMLLESVPEWAIDDQNKLNLILTYFESLSEHQIIVLKKDFNAEAIFDHIDAKRLFITTSIENLNNIGDIPFIYFIEPIDPPSFPENYSGRTQHRSNMLNQEFRGGKKYDGAGIKVGMHDDGIIGPHIDYEGRIIQQFPTTNNGNHGDHVSGTIMGAGNYDPKGRGMAPGAGLYVYSASNNNYDSVPSHYSNFDVIITSKSYSNGCNAGYTSLTQQLDQQTRTYPSLIHVFSAGNNGTSNCGYGAGANWGNITGGHKMGKNVIATGNLTSTDVIATSSSRGPADDGRIKPDICAKGTAVYSTIEGNDYDSYTGTSMACPGISGSMAQLYHAYKTLNGGTNPPSALMKGTMLNTADDLGNPGPDFIYGWGRVNLRRALEVLENNQYFTGQASSTTNTHVISVPSNTQQLNVMVYWHDYEGTVSSSKALVNNIDMTITNPSSTVILPWVLDPTPNATNLNTNATRGVDTLNNMEQITIDNPAAGNYTVSILPTLIPQGPQPYYVVYELVYNEIVLTYPNGGEGLVPGETELLRWDAYGTASTFDLEYSVNGGTSWSTIATSVSGASRNYNWTVPNSVTSTAKVRVTRGSISDDSDVNFNIIGVPQNLNIDWVCPDSLKLSWNNVSSAIGYTVHQLGNKYMDSVGSSPVNSYVFHNINLNSTNWFSVSSNVGAQGIGRRAIAIQGGGNVTNCPLDDDGSISQISAPNTGTYSTCDPNMSVSVYVKNQGQNDISSVPVFCNLNGSLALTGMVNDTLKPGDSTLLNLSGSLFPSPGVNSLQCFTQYPGDSNRYNDSVLSTIDYRTGTIVSAPWTEDFESYVRCGTANNCGLTICRLGNGWVNDSTYVIDDNDWRVDDQGTPSGGTGPSFDHKPGLVSGNYVFTEASEGCNFMTANLTTPCFDLSETTEPVLSFWYHMYGLEMGYLHVDVLANGRWNLDVIAPKGGNLGDFWRQDSIDLSDYNGSIVNVRFRGVTGSGYRSDMALDDISLHDNVDPTIGTKDFTSLNQIKIYPNPAKDQINIEWFGLDGGPLNIEISDLAGHRLIYSNLPESAEGRASINIDDLPAGIYMLHLTDGMTTRVEKIIVQ